MNVQPLSNGTEKILFKKLDDYSDDTPITLIKIDVEGMELEVLQGGVKLIIQSNFPPVLIESNEGDPKGPLVFQLLSEMGYDISKYAASDYQAQHPNFPAEMLK